MFMISLEVFLLAEKKNAWNSVQVKCGQKYFLSRLDFKHYFLSLSSKNTWIDNTCDALQMKHIQFA